MNDNTVTNADVTDGMVETVIAKIKQNEHDRDVALVSYYKSMAWQKTTHYSQDEIFRLAAEYLIRKGYTTITSADGVRKRLIKLGVIKTE